VEHLTDFIEKWSSSNTLKEKRKALNLTQSDMARKLRMPQGNYARWENGMLPQEHNQLRIAKILGCKRREIWK
jgi:transcriptional regulator with XRE-family HTH domain